MSAKPQRIQLRRTKGFNLQRKSKRLNGLPAVVVARPSRWGNPYKVDATHPEHGCPMSRGEAVDLYEHGLRTAEFDFTGDDIRRSLAGKNLACYCPLDQPCHADVLLRWAIEGSTAP